MEDQQREDDINAVCGAVLYTSIRSTGDYGGGGECPYCYANCMWNASIEDVKHEPNCVWLIAKDLLTTHK